MRASDFMELRAFELVARRRSFSRAAEDIGMSRAAISALVKSFEQRIGLQLLTRTTRSVALTEAGEQLLERLSPALRELVSAVSGLDEFRSRPRGRIKLLSCQLGADTCLRPLVTAFAAAEPDVVLDIHVKVHAGEHVSGDFDAEILPEGQIPGDLVALPLGPPTREVLVGSKGYIQRNGWPLSPAEFDKHHWIEVTGQSSSHGSARDGVRLRHYAGVAPIFHVNSYRFALDMVVMGLGLAFIPEPIARSAIDDGHVQHLLPTLGGALEPFSLCYAEHSYASLAFRSFLAFLQRNGPGCSQN